MVTYTYAPVNRKADLLRVMRETDVGETHFIWDNENIIREVDDTGLVEAAYTLEPKAYGKLVSQHRAAESSFFHFDALGSTRLLTDDNAAETDSYFYKAFGDLESSLGTTTNPFRWVGSLGYYYDNESGDYSLRRRQYQSDIGRFMSEDPIEYEGGDQNLYRLVGNNPTNEVDPSGLLPQDKVKCSDTNCKAIITFMGNCGPYEIGIGRVVGQDVILGANSTYCQTNPSLQSCRGGCRIPKGELFGLIQQFVRSTWGQDVWCGSHPDVARNLYIFLNLHCHGGASTDGFENPDFGGHFCNAVGDQAKRLGCGLVGLSGVDICQILKDLGKCVGNVSSKFEQLINMLGPNPTEVLNALMRALSSAVSCAIAKLKKEIKDVILSVLEGLLGIKIDPEALKQGALAAIASLLGLSLQNLVNWAWEAAESVFKGAADFWQKYIGYAAQTGSLGAAVCSGCRQQAAGNGRSSGQNCSLADILGDKIREAISGIWETLKREASAIFHDLVQGILRNQLGNLIEQMLKKLLGGAIKALLDALAALTKACDILEAMLDMLISALQELLNNPQGLADRLCELVYNFLKNNLYKIIMALLAALGLMKLLDDFRCQLANLLKRIKEAVITFFKNVFQKLLQLFGGKGGKGGKGDEPTGPVCVPPFFKEGQGPGGPVPGRNGGGVAPIPCKANCFVGGTIVHTVQGLVAIEAVQLGDRVDIYEECDQRRSIQTDSAIDPVSWRRIRLVLAKEGGSEVHINLLRPEGWLESLPTNGKGSVLLTLPELDAAGYAQVVAVEPYPAIASGPGRVVLGTFHHSAGDVYDVRLSDGSQLGVTARHPVWSVDRGEWVSVGDLEPGETLEALDGPVQFESATPRAEAAAVFNLEVDADHAYRVGEHGVLVHNVSAYAEITPITGGKGLEYATNWHKTRRQSGGDYLSPKVMKNYAEMVYQYSSRDPVQTISHTGSAGFHSENGLRAN